MRGREGGRGGGGQGGGLLATARVISTFVLDHGLVSAYLMIYKRIILPCMDLRFDHKRLPSSGYACKWYTKGLSHTVIKRLQALNGSRLSVLVKPY